MPEPWYKDYFAKMRRAQAQPDGEFMPFAVLRICLENRVPLPRWAALALLDIGDRLMQRPTRPGHNPSPHERDVQRSIDDFRHVVVSKFRKTEHLSLAEAIGRAVDYFNRNMADGGLPGKDGRIFRIAGETSAIRNSYWRVERLQREVITFPKLRKDYDPRTGK